MVNKTPDELDKAFKRTEKDFKELVKEEETKIIVGVLKEIFEKDGTLS
jgi:hypothetical protein